MKLLSIQISVHEPDDGGSCSVPKESSYDFVELGLGEAMVIKPYVFQDLRGEFVEMFN